jgi:hypothetical protein
VRNFTTTFKKSQENGCRALFCKIRLQKIQSSGIVDARLIGGNSMSLLTEISNAFTGAWDVFMLFIIPIGGGIPAGVILGHQKGIPWSALMAVYFVSDVMLACLLEPLMYAIIRISKHSAFFAKVHFIAKETTSKTLSLYPPHLGPLALIMVSFGIDPMTGRAATAAAGHGFVIGWLLAIAGDMIYFTLIMVCTLWLNHILGDGTWATVIILVLMVAGPMLYRRIREGRGKPVA